MLSKNAQKVSVEPQVSCRVQPTCWVQLAPELIVIHVIDFDLVESETFLLSNRSFQRPFLTFNQSASFLLLRPIRLNPLIQSSFRLVTVYFLQFEEIFLFILEPLKFTELYVAEDYVKQCLSDIQVG